MPFGHRHWLLGHPVPAEGSGPPHGRLARPTGSGPRRGFRVPHTRAATGVGALCTPRTVVLIPDRSDSATDTCRFSAASPCPPPPSHHAGVRFTRHQPRVHTCSPVRSSPRLWPPGWNEQALGLEPRASHPADQEPDNARRGGDRPSSTDLELPAQLTFRRSPIPIVLSWCATSRRTSRRRRPKWAWSIPESIRSTSLVAIWGSSSGCQHLGLRPDCRRAAR